MDSLFSLSFVVDGSPSTVNVRDRDLLVFVLRDQLRRTSVHIGCESGRCGACTVMLNGTPTKSCMVLARQVEGMTISTLEETAQAPTGEIVAAAFKRAHALQCGFCTPGMVTAVVGLLNRDTDVSEDDVRQALRGNLCRCTGYQHIVDAVLDAAATLREART
ncbi:(2Fe-2S)-binding protein [Rhodobacteraceae bacterium D3-12]|nr:(2Fe-2S)-binding protein [Rhodobacteraceae bacterium D3-12]